MRGCADASGPRPAPPRPRRARRCRRPRRRRGRLSSAGASSRCRSPGRSPAPPCASSTAAAGPSRRRRRARSAARSSAPCARAAGYRVQAGGSTSARRPRPLEALGAAEHGALRPGHPGQGLRLPDDARRDAAGGQRPAPGRSRALPHARRVLGLRLRQPGRAARARSRRSRCLLGYAVVDVNMRGTGCSGGAFDYFEPLQALDGYDVIETVARQPLGGPPQGRDDGHLLRRHQPALRRRHPARRASRRSRRCRSSTTPPRRSTRAGSSTRASRCPGPRTASTTRSRRPRPAARAGP